MFARTATFAIAGAALAACGVGVAADPAEVPDGTAMKVRLNQTLHSDRHGPGSGFTATVTEPVYGAEGETLVPAGSVVHGKILTFQEDPPRLQLEFTEVEVRGQTSSVEAALVEFEPTRRSEMKDEDEGSKTAGGATAGAVMGGLAGGDVGDTAVGAVAGTAAGTGVALLTKDAYTFVPAGSILQLELQQALLVATEEATQEAAEDQ